MKGDRLGEKRQDRYAESEVFMEELRGTIGLSGRGP